MLLRHLGPVTPSSRADLTSHSKRTNNKGIVRGLFPDRSLQSALEQLVDRPPCWQRNDTVLYNA